MIRVNRREILFSTIIIIVMLFSCIQDRKANSLGMNMIEIPAGDFSMGDSLGNWDEIPVHKALISNSFYISETEITGKQFQEFKKDYKFADEDYAIGVSWYEATDFCKWLSKKEGKNYRLPTEAEWEYICKKEGNWGVKNMLNPILEWCSDWYGSYADTLQVDPVGSNYGVSRVVRGGLPDDFIREYSHPESYYYRPTNRSGLAPSFQGFTVPVKENGSGKQSIQEKPSLNKGLTGIIYDDLKMKLPLEFKTISKVNSTELKWVSMNNWAAKWQGMIEAPHSGEIVFRVESDYEIQIEIAGETILSGKEKNITLTGVKLLKAGEKYPIVINYFHDGGTSLLKLFWSWKEHAEEVVGEEAFTHNNEDKDRIINEYKKGVFLRYVKPSIGFRIVQAPDLKSEYTSYVAPFVQQLVKQVRISNNSISNKPYFRKRFLNPIPPEDCSKEEIKLSGLHPSLGGHNHHPSIVECPNGDLLAIYFSSVYEDDPEVMIMGSRLRNGTEMWDIPTPIIDSPDVHDGSPLLWVDDNKIYLFWGNLHLKGGYPFQWVESIDNGATFSEIKYPNIESVIDGYAPQPITSIFRDKEGTTYLACDGVAAHSLLWASKDNMKTWFDTGGRTGGRHTSIIQLSNGLFFGVGGKKSDIDGFMPVSISTDKGKSWKISKSVFPSLGGGQRPILKRLKSGALLYAGDFQRKDGFQPKGVIEHGSFVALSDDEGENWKVKKLPGTLESSKEETAKEMKGETLGYVSIDQGEDGMIHLITSKNAPSLHFEFNESWILSNEILEMDDNELMKSTSNNISKIENYIEKYANGKTKAQYSGGISNDGRFLLDGKEEWFYKDGAKKYEATFKLGIKIGSEKYYSNREKLIWERNFNDSNFIWKQYWGNGKLKLESHWENMKCNGTAKIWDKKGLLFSNVIFKNGKIITKNM